MSSQLPTKKLIYIRKKDRKKEIIGIEDQHLYDAIMNVQKTHIKNIELRPNRKTSSFYIYVSYNRLINPPSLPPTHYMAEIASHWESLSKIHKDVFVNWSNLINKGDSIFILGKSPKTIWKETRIWLSELSFSLNDLPALLLVEIYDNYVDNSERVPMYLKWDVITKIKHFHRDNEIN